MLLMEWIKYTDTNRTCHVKATISSSGYLTFTQGAVQKFRMEEYGHIVLYFHPPSNQVGIELVHDGKVPGAKKLRIRGGGADVVIRPFLEKFGIRPEVTTRFEISRDADSGFLVLQLSAGQPRKSNSTGNPLTHQERPTNDDGSVVNAGYEEISDDDDVQNAMTSSGFFDRTSHDSEMTG